MVKLTGLVESGYFKLVLVMKNVYVRDECTRVCVLK